MRPRNTDQGGALIRRFAANVPPIGTRSLVGYLSSNGYWRSGKLLALRPPPGRRVEQHHPVPRSRGGRDTVPVHPICHRALHKSFTDTQLERLDLAALRFAPQLAPFLAWIANKDPDFHAPARSRR